MIVDGAPEFSRPVLVDKLSAKGNSVTIEADSRERAAVAARLDLAALERLVAEVEVKPLGRSGIIAVNGRLTAEVTQTCGVTLAPLPARIEERFRLCFAPSEAAETAEETGGELDLSWDGDDPPDPIVDGVIDIGEVVVEHLSLALDPFPRAPDAAFVAPEEEPEVPPAKAGPFAKLAELRRVPRGNC